MSRAAATSSTRRDPVAVLVDQPSSGWKSRTPGRFSGRDVVPHLVASDYRRRAAREGRPDDDHLLVGHTDDDLLAGESSYRLRALMASATDFGQSSPSWTAPVEGHLPEPLEGRFAPRRTTARLGAYPEVPMSRPTALRAADHRVACLPGVARQPSPRGSRPFARSVSEEGIGRDRGGLSGKPEQLYAEGLRP
jgi:hypothetical protein